MSYRYFSFDITTTKNVIVQVDDKEDNTRIIDVAKSRAYNESSFFGPDSRFDSCVELTNEQEINNAISHCDYYSTASEYD